MSQLQIIDITRQQLDEGILLSNQVLVETEITSDGRKTQAGIIVSFNEDVTYAEGDNSLAADVCIPYGTVYRTPQELYFNEKDEASMLWDCEMELQKGDKVWFSIMESYNAVTFRVDGKYYKLLPYGDIFVAKRKVLLIGTITPEEVIKTYKQTGMILYSFPTEMELIICLNGFCLCEPINLKKISELDHISEGKLDPTKGIVRFFGKPNKRYKDKNSVDFQDLKEGDEVLFARQTPLMLLERKSYMSTFNGDKLYYVVQRRKIVAVLNR